MDKSTDYHDYVFREGKLVAEFEEMYRNSATIPWHQDKQENWIDVRLTKELLQDVGRFAELHDFGCGTGHYLDLMVKHSLAANGKSFGYDVLATACEKAAGLFPHTRFSVFDLTQRVARNKQEISNNEKPARLFMIRGTLWYVFPKLATVIKNIADRMRYPDRLLVVQNWPPQNNAFIGKDVLPDHFALLEHFSSHFVVERQIWYEDCTKDANDNWFIGLFKLKEKN